MQARLADGPRAARGVPRRTRGLPRRARAALGDVPEIDGHLRRRHARTGSSACTSSSAHSLAAGPGVNPLGDEALAALPDWWAAGPCVTASGAPMTRVAAIDCGTNSIRLLVADVDPRPARWSTSTRRMEIVRLGEGVDRTGRLSRRPPSSAPSRPATDYADRIAELGAERMRFVATSASRDAENRGDFVAGVLERLGVEPEVVTGDEEAALSFDGATRELLGPRQPAPFLVVDIGGGSTEFVLGETGRSPRARSTSAACGSPSGTCTATRRPPRRDRGRRADIDGRRRRVRRRPCRSSEARTLVGLAGSVTTVAAHRTWACRRTTPGASTSRGCTAPTCTASPTSCSR